jgi:hypothetical protein
MAADAPLIRSPHSAMTLHCAGMVNRNSDARLDEDICIHVFTVSAAMVGVCLTVIGVLRVVMTVRKVDTLADDFLAGDAVLFLVACLTAYWALRTRRSRRLHGVERFADFVFIVALVFMVVICGYITYAIAIV